MHQSCVTCPSYIDGDDVTEFKSRFNRPPGGPMCGRYGHVLGSAKSTESELEAIGVFYASDCESHGQPRPPVPDSINPAVAHPDPIIHDDTSVREIPNSCRVCVNFVTESAVYDDFGWSVGLCRAKGSLVFRPLAAARNCNESWQGTPSDTTEGITLLDQYIKGYSIPTEVAMASFVYAGTDDVGEPSTQDSDAPVTSEQESEGIRAWRKITDPSNDKRSLYAPIFRSDFFTDDERELIPTTGGKSNPELYVDYNQLLYRFMVESFMLDETPVLVGPPGTGKTQFFRWAAWLCQMPFRRVQFYDDMDVTELLGSTQYHPEKGTFFEPGVLPVAWQSVGFLDLDEPNLGPDAATQVLRPVLDNSKELIIENRTFKRADYCFFGMAMNPSYDFRNIGTKELADADTNRLSFLEVEPAPEVVERHLIKTYCKTLDGYDIPEDVVNTLMSISEDIRDLEKQGQFPGTWATRQMIKVARKTRWYEVADAFRVSSLNNLPPEVRSLVYTSITTHTGTVIQ